MNEKFKAAISEALTEEYEGFIPNIEKHSFSPKFEKEMSKLIERRKKPYYKLINTFGKRAACIIAGSVIASSLTVMNVDALREAFIKFVVNTFEKFSIVRSVDGNNSPDTIEEIYEITCDMSGYDVDYLEQNEIFYNITYSNGNIIVDYNQWIKSEYDILLNTENAEIETISINGKSAMYFCDNHNYDHIIWDNGDYIISLDSNIGKNALFEMANSVQKRE